MAYTKKKGLVYEEKRVSIRRKKGVGGVPDGIHEHDELHGLVGLAVELVEVQLHHFPHRHWIGHLIWGLGFGSLFVHSNLIRP